MAKEVKTLEQLEAEYENAKRALNAARELEAKKAAEEAERKRTELAKAKETRKKEVDDAIAHAFELLNAYTEDYGSYNYEEDDHIKDFSIVFGRNPFRFFL